jgi:thiosulfate reductase/polysulfide reductase chain A
MGLNLTRRKFLQTASIAAASVSLAKVAPAKASFTRQPFTAPGSFAGTKTEVGGICEMCFWRCQLVGKVRDGKLVKLEGNPKSIDNGTAICARGNAGVELLYDPDRLKTPLKNVGKRGAPQWRQISWEEALDECASRLKKVEKKYGPHGIAMFPHGASAKYPMQYFEHTVGTPNVSEASFFQCRGIRDMAFLQTFGHPPGENVDMANAKAIFLMGCHFGENVHVSHAKKYLKGLENNAKLIVVDPRFSASAAKADMWVKIKAGYDTALLLAIMNHLIKTGKYNKEFVANNCTGFKQFKKAISGWTVKKVAVKSDVPASQIIEIAETLAANAPNVSIHPGRYTSWHGNDFQRARALACLTAILGAYGVPGGLVKPKGPKVGKVGWHGDGFNEDYDLSGPWPFKPPGTPTDAMRNTMLTGTPYPIKAAVVWGQNPIQTIPNQKMTIDALKKMDFVMVVDVMPTDITMYADILLPESSYLERHDYIKKGTEWDHSDTPTQFISARMPLVPPMFQRKDPIYITNEIAKRMGHGDHLPAENMEEYVNKQLAKANLSLDKLKKEDGIHIQKGKSAYFPKGEKKHKFDTDSGKIELYSEALADEDFPPTPVCHAAPDVPAGYARLLYGRTPVHSFSRTQNNRWLNFAMPENPLWLNDESAAKMGLKDGDRIELINQDGAKSRTSTVLKVTPGIRKDAVYMAHGFGTMNPEMTVAQGKGIDDQSLITRLAVDPETGAHGMRNNFVKIIKDGKVLNIPK